MPGPRRFTDLLDGLPGISRKLLTERLRDLEADGIVGRRDLPAPAARQVYELTGDGRDLAEAMRPLIAWGARRLGDRDAGETFRARWSSVGMASLADRAAAGGVSETYQYVIGDAAFHFVVDDGSIEARDGHAPAPAVTVTTDEETWEQVVSGRLATSEAVRAGRLEISGGRAATRRLRAIFGRRALFA